MKISDTNEIQFDKLWRLVEDVLKNRADSGWKNFGDSDPGITLLQAMTYCVSDVSYRHLHDLVDLMKSDGTAFVDSVAELKLLQRAPYSENDFRKILVGHVDEKKNRPIFQNVNFFPSRGAVDIFPSFSAIIEDISDATLFAKFDDLVKANVKVERFSKKKILKSDVTSLVLNIEVFGSADEVMANVFIALFNALAPGPVRQFDRVDRQRRIGAWLSGPELTEGWLDGFPPVLEKTEGWWEARLNDARRKIRAVPGVKELVTFDVTPSVDGSPVFFSSTADKLPATVKITVTDGSTPPSLAVIRPLLLDKLKVSRSAVRNTPTIGAGRQRDVGLPPDLAGLFPSAFLRGAPELEAILHPYQTSLGHLCERLRDIPKNWAVPGKDASDANSFERLAALKRYARWMGKDEFVDTTDKPAADVSKEIKKSADRWRDVSSSGEVKSDTLKEFIRADWKGDLPDLDFTFAKVQTLSIANAPVYHVIGEDKTTLGIPGQPVDLSPWKGVLDLFDQQNLGLMSLDRFNHLRVMRMAWFHHVDHPYRTFREALSGSGQYLIKIKAFDSNNVVCLIANLQDVSEDDHTAFGEGMRIYYHRFVLERVFRGKVSDANMSNKEVTIFPITQGNQEEAIFIRVKGVDEIIAERIRAALKLRIGVEAMRRVVIVPAGASLLPGVNAIDDWFSGSVMPEYEGKYGNSLMDFYVMDVRKNP